jgi:hypothetical protein
MTSTDGEWPSYDDLGSKDHLHAIGVIAAGRSFIETQYQAFTQLIFHHHIKASIRVFELLGNDSRWQLIRDELALSLPERESDLVFAFLKSGGHMQRKQKRRGSCTVLLLKTPAYSALARAEPKILMQ